MHPVRDRLLNVVIVMGTKGKRLSITNVDIAAREFYNLVRGIIPMNLVLLLLTLWDTPIEAGEKSGGKIYIEIFHCDVLTCHSHPSKHYNAM